MRHHIDVIAAALIVVAMMLLTHTAQHHQPGTVRPAQHGTTVQVVAP